MGTHLNARTRALKFHSTSLQVMLRLAAAATRAAFYASYSMPKGPGAEIAKLIVDARGELSLADLQSIAAAAIGESRSLVHAHIDGRAGSPASRIRALLPCAPGKPSN